jgi:bifunctional non-homologous end joining protein LigD
MGSRITEELPESVASSRTIEEIARDQDRVWHSNKSVKENVKAGAIRPHTRTDIASVEGARKAPMPEQLQPELATLVDAVPDGDEWLHEIKYDGYRMLTRIEGGRAVMFSRNGHDWSAKFPSLTATLARVPLTSAWLDGEVVAIEPDGRTSFSALQDALSRGVDTSLVYYVFDLLYLDGFDLRKAPLSERKRLLQSLPIFSCPPICYSQHVEGSGPELLQKACNLRLEGIVSKRMRSRYASRRSNEWLKIKCERRQEFVIGGFTDPGGSRTGFGALLLGVYEPSGELTYVGKVGTGFNQTLLDQLRRKLDTLGQSTPPFANPPKGAEARRSHWVRPELVAEVSYTEWTKEGALRHPSFLGLRTDKLARQVVRERVEPTDEVEPSQSDARAVKPKPAKTPNKPGTEDEATIAGIKLSNPDKALYPDGITKRDLARYYESIGEWIVPHLKGRPLTLLRCPNGINGGCFYQKNIDQSAPAAIEPVEIQDGDGASTS